ncbi:hypothetical protein EDD16DRAFT_1631954 [Pisolithus croceorrhizus]|nr:hypothetical protein EDD16DRAFT_1631954 [Pisolithus croceorrhizus]
MPSTHGPHTSIPAHHCRPSVSSQLHEGGNARNPDHPIGPVRLTICLKATTLNHVHQPSRHRWLVLRGKSDDHWAVSEWIRGAMAFVSYAAGGTISECPKMEIRMALGEDSPELTDIYMWCGGGGKIINRFSGRFLCCYNAETSGVLNPFRFCLGKLTRKFLVQCFTTADTFICY